MVSKVIQWILSKLFPYNKPLTVNEYTTGSSWHKQKLRENEEFYGRQDGWGC